MLIFFLLSFHFYNFSNQYFLSRRTAVKIECWAHHLWGGSLEQRISECLADGSCQCCSHLQVLACKTKWTKPNRKTHSVFNRNYWVRWCNKTSRKYSKSGNLKISLCSKKAQPFKPFCFHFLVFQKANPHHSIPQHPCFHLDFYQQFIWASLKCTWSFNVKGAACAQQLKGKSSTPPFSKLVPPQKWAQTRSFCFLMGIIYSCMGSTWLGQVFDLHQTGRSSFAFLMLQENKDAPARDPTPLGEFMEGRMSLIGNSPRGSVLAVQCLVLPFQRKFPAHHTLHHCKEKGEQSKSAGFIWQEPEMKTPPLQAWLRALIFYLHHFIPQYCPPVAGTENRQVSGITLSFLNKEPVINLQSYCTFPPSSYC